MSNPIPATIKNTRLWRRVEPSTELAGKLASFIPPAIALLGNVARHMPLYTLHDATHIRNVVAWMAWLLEDVVEHLTPLEAALCLFAAHTHDLGMACGEPEFARLKKAKTPTSTTFALAFKSRNATSPS